MLRGLVSLCVALGLTSVGGAQGTTLPLPVRLPDEAHPAVKFPGMPAFAKSHENYSGESMVIEHADTVYRIGRRSHLPSAA